MMKHPYWADLQELLGRGPMSNLQLDLLEVVWWQIPVTVKMKMVSFSLHYTYSSHVFVLRCDHHIMSGFIDLMKGPFNQVDKENQKGPFNQVDKENQRKMV